jgi:uncharacterized membrane protein
MSWDVHFINGYTRRLQIAIMFKHDPCSEYGRPWGTRGWWLLNPGEEAYVLDTNNRFFYYYAEATDGSRLWTSESPIVPVPPRKFDLCIDIGSTDARGVGMRILDLNVNNRWRLT